MTGQCRTAQDTSFKPNQPTANDVMAQLCAELEKITIASRATPGCQALAALACASRCARKAGMPAPVAAALLADYIVRDDPD
jgi:hypothetical protein